MVRSPPESPFFLHDASFAHELFGRFIRRLSLDLPIILDSQLCFDPLSSHPPPTLPLA